MELMKTTLLTVHLVLLNVPLVKHLLITVKLVLKEELIQIPDVFVLMVNISTIMTNTVEIVLTNVLPVVLKLLVFFVLTLLEMKVPFVIVKIITMIMVPQNVQDVKKNVTFVLTVHLTVPFVLKEESIHQNVTFLHQALNPLKLLIFQLVPLKLSCVTINVPLVKEPLIFV